MHVVHCNAFFFAQRALSLYMLPKVIAKLTCGIVFAAFSLSDNYPSSLWLVKGERWVFNSLLEPQRKRKFELVPYILDLKWIHAYSYSDEFSFFVVFSSYYTRKKIIWIINIFCFMLCAQPLCLSHLFSQDISMYSYFQDTELDVCNSYGGHWLTNWTMPFIMWWRAKWH